MMWQAALHSQHSLRCGEAMLLLGGHAAHLDGERSYLGRRRD
jgi:hypothetical protein